MKLRSPEHQIARSRQNADPETGDTSLADRIREYTYDHIIRPALREGRAEIAVRAGDVHSAMRLNARIPAVCSALESRKFAESYGLVLIRRQGPHRGSNVFYHFRASQQPDPYGASEGRSQPRDALDSAASPRNGSNAESPDPPGTAYWISCVSRKRARPAPAKDLYVSDWFSKARRYVESKGAPWFVLSAKYGLVAPEEIIHSYDLTLNRMGVAERKRWTDRVLNQVAEKAPDVKRIVLLAGMRYREFLEPKLRAKGIDVQVPMEGLRIGEQLSWLDEHAR